MQRNSNRAVMEGGQALDFFLPQIHDWFWKGKEGCSVFEGFSEVFCSGLILLPLISAGEESSCC